MCDSCLKSILISTYGTGGSCDMMLGSLVYSSVLGISVYEGI